MKGRIRYAFVAAAGGTRKSWVWLMKLMIPISLGVTLLQHFGIIAWLAQYLEPLFIPFGLPGSSAVIFLSGALAGTYAGVAALTIIPLTLRQATILGLMIALCHALPMESAVNHKTGSSFWKMSAIRVVMAFVCAAYLNLLLPEMKEPFLYLGADEGESLSQVLLTWCWSQLKLSVMVAFIIYALMVVQQLLIAYNMLQPISKALHPLMVVFGLRRSSAYMWLVGNVLGISYGSAVMIELQEKGIITREDANEVNYHLIMSHSLLEDTIVLALTGIPLFWILSTRILFAIVVVWMHNAVSCIRKKMNL